MFWFKQKYALEDIETILDMAFDRACAMYEEARKSNMVDLGMLPQTHLSRDDMLKNLKHLRAEGGTKLGRRFGTPEEEDLTARDD